jgi:hypothetical protein
MKPLTRLFAFLLLLFLSNSLNAQVFEQIKGMSQGAHNALVLEIQQADEKLVAEVWNTFMKERYKVKLKRDRKSKEHFADDALIPAIGLGNTVDVYAVVEPRGSNALLNVWFDLGGAYLSLQTHPDRFSYAESMLLAFNREVAREKVRQQLRAEEENLGKLQKDLARLVSAHERSQKEIERAREAIKKAEADIAQNEAGQEALLEQINRQQSAIDAVMQVLSSM